MAGRDDLDSEFTFKVGRRNSKQSERMERSDKVFQYIKAIISQLQIIKSYGEIPLFPYSKN